MKHLFLGLALALTSTSTFAMNISYQEDQCNRGGAINCHNLSEAYYNLKLMKFTRILKLL